jgi:hypothetical protein
MHARATGRAALAAAGVLRFAPIAPADYAAEFALLGRLAATTGAGRGPVSACQS